MIAWPVAHVIWVLLQADGSQWSWVTQQEQHVPGFLPWMCHRCFHNASILTCVCITRPSESGLRVLGCFTHHCWRQRHIVLDMWSNPSICPMQLHAGLQFPPFKWLKLFNRSTYSSVVVPRVNFANTAHLSKHHSYCLQNKNRGRKKIGFLSSSWSPITVTNESLTLQPLIMHTL